MGGQDFLTIKIIVIGPFLCCGHPMPLGYQEGEHQRWCGVVVKSGGL